MTSIFDKFTLNSNNKINVNDEVDDTSVNNSNGYDNQAFNDKITHVKKSNKFINKFIGNSRGPYSHSLLKEFFNNNSRKNYDEKFLCAIKRFFTLLVDESDNNNPNTTMSSKQNKQLVFSIKEFDYNPVNPHINILGSIVNEDMYVKSVLPTIDGKTMKITEPDVIKKRLNYAISGNSDIDFLNGTRSIITGGIMSATNVHINPLSIQFIDTNYENNSEELFKKFVDKYYENSDIDIIMDEKNDLVFIESFVRFLNKLNYNIISNLKIKESNISVTINKTGYFDYNTNFKINNPSFFDDNGIPIREKFYNRYIEMFDKSVEDNKKDIKLNNYIPSNIGSSLPNVLSSKKIELESLYIRYTEKLQPNKPTIFNTFAHMYFTDDETYSFKTINKFKISSKYLRRPIEVFNAKQGIIKCIKGFHLPCVRSYFDTDASVLNIVCPRALTAYTTMINTCFVYYNSFNDNKSMNTISNKYISRGYGIVVNNAIEKETILKNINNESNDFIPFDNKIFNIDTKISEELSKQIKCSFDRVQEINDLDFSVNNSDDKYRSYWCDPSRLVNNN